jgi:hypothetical protein
MTHSKHDIQASRGTPVPRFLKQSSDETVDGLITIPTPYRRAWSSSSDDLLLEFLHGSQRNTSSSNNR